MTGRDLLKELEDYAKDFIQTEKFHELENSHGLSFEILADEYQRNQEKIVELKGEVEELLYHHPAVAEVSVIGIPDPYRGESPKTFIVLRPEYKGKIKEEEIVEWAKDNMATYKRPRVVEFRDELPKSAADKILRRVLIEEEKLRRK